MNNIFRTIFLLKSFSTGLMLPIMSLMIISRGAGTELLPLVIGVYSLTVILFEFPSGVFSDIFGRKKTFLISCSLMLLSLFLLIVKHPMFLFCFGICYSGNRKSLFLRQSGCSCAGKKSSFRRGRFHSQNKR